MKRSAGPTTARDAGRGSWLSFCEAGIPLFASVAVLLLLVLGGVTLRRSVIANFEQARATALVNSLHNADIAQVREIVERLQEHPNLSNPILTQQVTTVADDPQRKLNFSLALSVSDTGQVDYLVDRLLQAESDQFPVIRDFLADHADEVVDRLWQASRQTSVDGRRQAFRAACALAMYDPTNPRWHEIRVRVAEDLVNVNPAFLGVWREALAPVAGMLIEPLTAIYRDPQQQEVARSLATALLSDYAKDEVGTLTELLCDGDSKQFGVLFPVLQKRQAEAVSQLNDVLDETLVASWNDTELDSSWPPVGQAVQQAVTSAHGMLDERFALCQSMPLQEFLLVAESLRSSGYRPVRFRPFAHQDGVLVAAAWTRDDRAWQLAQGLNAEEILKRDEQLRSEGFSAVDVAGYVQSTTQGAVDRYGAVWMQLAGDAENARIYVGASNLAHRRVYQSLQKLGYTFQHSLQSFRAVDGQQKYSGVRSILVLLWQSESTDKAGAGRKVHTAAYVVVADTKTPRQLAWQVNQIGG